MIRRFPEELEHRRVFRVGYTAPEGDERLPDGSVTLKQAISEVMRMDKRLAPKIYLEAFSRRELEQILKE
jgi:hypothetical protein